MSNIDNLNRTVARLIVDVSNVIYSSLMKGKDSELGFEATDDQGKKSWVNSHKWGFDGALDLLTSTMKTFNIPPQNVILVSDGPHSKLVRQRVFDGYKAGRTKSPEVVEQFGTAKEMLLTQMRGVGAQAVYCEGGLEADDTIGYLARNLEGVRFILSNDKDLAQLVGPGPKDRLTLEGRTASAYPGAAQGLEFDPTAWTGYVHQLRMGEMNKNPFGEFPHRFIPLAIALVGDSVDKIPGAKGFGATSFAKMAEVFGAEGLGVLEGLMQSRELSKLAEDADEFKPLTKILADAENVYMSYDLGRLHVEKVGTMNYPLKWDIGMVLPLSEATAPQITRWAGQRRIVSQANYAQALDFLRKKMDETSVVCLDLETAVGEESEDWLARRSAKGGGVDVLGSRITGCGISFGANNQYHYYIVHNHKEADGVENLGEDQLGAMLTVAQKGVYTVAHNAGGFELPVLLNHFGDAWQGNGWRGFYPEMVDSRIGASYWDEDQFTHGLKHLSKELLGYEQVNYDTVTSVTVQKSLWDGGGKIESEIEGEDGAVTLKVRYRMDELSALHVLSYGIDDIVTTQALWQHFRCFMELESTWEAFKRLEVKPLYLTASAYVQGMPISLEHINSLAQADTVKFDAYERNLHKFLCEVGWDGTACPVFDEVSAANVKEAYKICQGEDLKTLVRTPSKLARLMEETQPVLAALVEAEDVEGINRLVKMHFKAMPKFDVASPKQVASFLYSTLGMPIRLRNKATAVMRAKGIREGTPRTDDDAIKMSQKMGDVAKGSTEHGLLSALIEMKSICTKRGLYYEPYPLAVHWKTRRLHPELIQSATNTRRWTSRNVNIQQLDSDAGGIRSAIRPHHRNAVVVSLDESAQEVRQTADYCLDPNLLSCYRGDASKLRDVHSIVGCKIAGVSYEEFRARLKSSDPEVASEANKVRQIAKVCVFASLYGAMAPKIAESLGIPEREAQGYIDAIYSEFSELAAWKARTESHAERFGWIPVWGGTVRHLNRQIQSDDKWVVAKALRQASNASIQGAGANQIKTVMSKVWDSRLLDDYDFKWYAPIHDEVVYSVGKGDVVEVTRQMHEFMTAQFLGTVPSASSIGLGKDFGRLIELGEKFDPSAIQGALDNLFPATETV